MAVIPASSREIGGLYDKDQRVISGEGQKHQTALEAVDFVVSDGENKEDDGGADKRDEVDNGKAGRSNGAK